MRARNQLLGFSFLFLAQFFFDPSLRAAAEIRFQAERVKAQELYLLKCAKCHKLHDPSGYDDEAWDAWINKMRHKAHLSQEQFEKISRYCASLRDKTAV